VIKFGVRKLEYWGYQTVKNHDASFLRFDTIPTRDGRTHGRTDRRTDRHVAISITRVSSAGIASRG